jgi:hypothetical protein
MGAVAVMKPPVGMSTLRTCEGEVIARKRYLVATTFSRYCASADVGQGAP